ncbi:hypothetical protein RB195_023391 [Necator americanus]|uniref:Uncharacterized protein n=1 Tax=Necator americanus TaxID=51031 RepID=A0ABR1EIZ2_NECAM
MMRRQVDMAAEEIGVEFVDGPLYSLSRCNGCSISVPESSHLREVGVGDVSTGDGRRRASLRGFKTLRSPPTVVEMFQVDDGLGTSLCKLCSFFSFPCEGKYSSRGGDGLAPNRNLVQQAKRFTDDDDVFYFIMIPFAGRFLRSL